MKKIRVTYFQRKPYAGHWSIETIFEKLRMLLADRVVARTKIASFISRGFFKRIAISIEAAFYQSDVNHITGDFHYVAAFIKPSRTVLTIHDCGILKDTPPGMKRRIFLYFWYQMPAKRARHITVVSDFTKRELLSYLPSLSPQKITVIPPFISEAFVATPKEFNKVCPTLLHIGIAENKNLNRLIEAIEGLSCSLTIIGKLTSEQQQKLEKYHIYYRAVSNISEAQMVIEFTQADILTFVSTFEGFGMPIIEANKVGRPVLTSSIASMPDVAGDAACLVDPYDVQSIREGLLRIIGNDGYRSILVKNGFRNADRFNNQIIAQQYYDIYCHTISHH